MPWKHKICYLYQLLVVGFSNLMSFFFIVSFPHNSIAQLVKKFLEVKATYLGYIIESDHIRDSVDEMIPFLIKNPQSKPSENLQQIIGALTNTDLQFVKRDGRIFVSKQVRLSSGWEV